LSSWIRESQKNYFINFGASNHFFCFKDKKMITTAVTGTNGKSTTVEFVGQILSSNQQKVASLGNLGSI